MEVWAGLLVILIAGWIQGLTSFGFSLIAVPLLGMFLPLQIFVPMLVLFSLIINSIIIINFRKNIEIKRITYLLIAGIIGTPFGTYLLLHINENILKTILGVMILISAAAMFFGYKVNIKNERLANLPVGFVSGLLNGSLSVSGPPIILFLTNQSVEKKVFRANLTAYFLILNIMTIPSYFIGGLITDKVIHYTFLFLPALIIGVYLGIKFSHKIKDKYFEKIVLILIGTMGIMSIITGIR